MNVIDKLIKDNIDPHTQALRMDCYCLTDSLIETLIVELEKMYSTTGIKMFGGESRTYILAAYKKLHPGTFP